MADTPEKIGIAKNELTERVDDPIVVATIEKAPVSIPHFSNLFLRSCQVLEQYKTDIQSFCSTQKLTSR